MTDIPPQPRRAIKVFGRRLTGLVEGCSDPGAGGLLSFDDGVAVRTARRWVLVRDPPTGRTQPVHEACRFAADGPLTQVVATAACVIVKARISVHRQPS